MKKVRFGKPKCRWNPPTHDPRFVDMIICKAALNFSRPQSRPGADPLLPPPPDSSDLIRLAQESDLRNAQAVIDEAMDYASHWNRHAPARQIPCVNT